MRFWWKFLSHLLTISGVIASFLTVLMLVAFLGQLSKNRKVHGDFIDRVRAVSDFRAREGRLPSQSELNQLSEALLARYSRYEFEINTTLSEVPKPLHDELNDDNWTLSFWRGEWSEYYLSWNGYNSLDWQVSYFHMGRTFVIPPLVVAFACFFGAWKLNQRVKSRFQKSSAERHF